MTKSLLLKGLAGVAAVGGVVAGGAVYGKDLILGGSGNKPGEALNVKTASISHKELIDKAGLDCGLTGKEVTEDKECSVKSEGTITVKVENQTEEGVTFTSSQSSKLKVRRSEKGGGGTAAENYNEGLKFVVDSGDISLTKKDGSTSSATITKLEQFETYEIKEEGGKYFLLRKTKADVGIKNALGLGQLTLPEAGRGDSSDSYNDEKKKKQIRFEGHEDGITVTGEIGLKVSKTVDTTTFPFGYRFNFTFPADVNINGKQLKGNIPYEFKIKKGAGNALTLEQAWTDDNVFTKKAGLDCSSNPNECSVSSTGSQKLNVKLGHQKKEGIASFSGGKIKMEKDQSGYNQGLKFSITSGDVTLGDGGTGDAITKLEELETYEIAEDGGKYYLTKKTSPDQLIKTSLGIKDVCELPTTDSPVSCTLDADKFKAINFDAKGTSEVSAPASVTLKISKANSTDFPFGYKFTFSTTQEATVSSTNKIKKGIPTDYKIKKGAASGQSTSLFLERAWNDTNYTLAAKVGLDCSSSDTCCTKTGTPTVKLNVKKGTEKKEGIDSVVTSSGKIKVEKDQEGYNQGLKFTITTGDVTFTGGNGGTFSSLEELETYEITDEGGKYYLTRKTSKEDVLKTSLSIPEKCFTQLGTSCELTTDDFKNINFDGKSNFSPSGTATLTITKADSKDFPLGYRFTFNTTAEATIASSNKIKKNIPTDFKIKKNQSTPTTLTLEKAWTDGDYSFAKKVGLTCTDSNGCCSQTAGTSEKLNVKKGNDKKTDITSFNSGTGGSGKIKVEKEQEGYNQGLKFTISDGGVTLTGGNKVEGSTNDITTLEELETYEITEEGGKYYLTRKSGPEDLIKSSLSLPSGCELPTSSTEKSCSLSADSFKNINFDGKSSPTASGTVTLKISKANSTDFPFGYKFTFETTADATIKTNDTIKAKIPTDFKIKKAASGQSPALSLEKAWTADSLGKKVGLSCTGSGTDECCTKASGSGQLNIKKGEEKKENIASFGGSGSNGGKIKVEKDQEGYNQGLKFTISGGDVKLTGGSGTSTSEDLSILEEYETYEIKENGGKWYLTRKDESIVYIKKQLGLDFCSSNTWSRVGSDTSGFNSTFNCDYISLENLKKIKIKNANNNWPTGNISLQVSIERKKTNNSDTYEEVEVEIGDQSSQETSVCVPDGAGGKVDVKTATGNPKYKINKGSGSPSSWCLVKKDGGSSSGQCTN